MKWLSFFLILSLTCFAFADDEVIKTDSEAQTDEETKVKPQIEAPPSFKKFELRVNPLILAIPGNADINFYFTPQISAGLSMFATGGCANIGLSATPGSRCNSWNALGVRGNFYSDTSQTRHGYYGGVGLYNITKKSEYRFGANNILKGEFSAPGVAMLGGYYFQTTPSLSFYFGLGGFILLNKPDDMIVSEGGVQTTISTEAANALLYEFGISYKF